jgi:hypothetical protein
LTTSDMSPVLRFIVGLAVIACGVMPILAAFAIGPFQASEINGPPWLGAVAGGIFVLGGVFVWASNAAVRYPWIGSAVAMLLLVGLAAIGNWIAFGAGVRECSGGPSGAVPYSWDTGNIECLAAFGIGALIIDGMLVWMLGTGLRKAGMDGPLPIWIERIGKAMLLVALAPIVLLLIVLTAGKAFAESFVTFCRTGKWPHNEEFIARRKKRAQESVRI